MEVIGRGAEAVLTRTAEGITKERLAKRYRHPSIDKELREQRTKMEFRILQKAQALGVKVPSVQKLGDDTLVLEEIKGPVIKDVLDDEPKISEQIGLSLARLHDEGIMHADLTTSNMMLQGEEVVLIDFGLSFHSQRIEDKAVDLHLFKQSLMSKHHRVMKSAWKHFLKGYAQASDSQQVQERLRAVERRGRNKGS